MAELKIKADSGGGTVSFKGPATTTGNNPVQLTLPVDDGTANQVLTTNGSGALSWAAPVIADDSIVEAKLDVSNSPTNGQFLQAQSGEGGGLTWAAVVGISDVDQWYLKSSVTSNGTLTDLGRSSDKWPGAAAQIGTGMSVSSGIFTFPSTGKWLVIAHAYLVIAPGDQVALETHVTTNNSSYAMTCSAVDGQNDGGSTTRSGSATTWAFLDVTDTSNVKVKFEGNSIATNSEVRGTDTLGNGMFSHFTFIRVGAT